METKKKTKVNKSVGVVFGHKVEDMKVSIERIEGLGLIPLIVTWPRYENEFDNYEVLIQKTPEHQGMDCINLVHKSAQLLFQNLGDRNIYVIANHHTKPTLWNWELTNEEWQSLFDFNPNQKRYVDELIEERYNQFYGIKDSDEQDISGLTE